MLTLTRKAGQAIVIDETTTVVIDKIDGNRVKVRIVAPRHINVRRAELSPLPEKSYGSRENERRHAEADPEATPSP